MVLYINIISIGMIIMLVVEPDYLPDSEVFFSCAWIPFSDGGVCGGFPPHYFLQGGLEGAKKINGAPPLVVDLRAVPLRRNFGKNFLIKYCNFIVNLDHSL
jgi:hypothetical protein